MDKNCQSDSSHNIYHDITIRLIFNKIFLIMKDDQTVGGRFHGSVEIIRQAKQNHGIWDNKESRW